MPGYVVLTGAAAISAPARRVWPAQGAAPFPSGLLGRAVLFRNQGGGPGSSTSPNPPGNPSRSCSARAWTRLREPQSGPATPRSMTGVASGSQLRSRVPDADPRRPELIASGASEIHPARCRGWSGPSGSRALKRGTPPAAAQRVPILRAPTLPARPGAWWSAACVSSRLHASCGTTFETRHELTLNAGNWPPTGRGVNQDRKQRGLLDEGTLVVWAARSSAGRGWQNRPGYKEVRAATHHPFGISMWMAGGGPQGRPGLRGHRRNRLVGV
jgi:hypothetical protein